MDNNLVSIVVPVFKAAAYIEKTIDTVVKQTYSNWELLLVDDCSPDNSVEIISRVCENLPGEISARIHLIRQPINEGAAKARNTGIDSAAGRYIAFLDADDLWDEHKLELELDFMIKHEAAFVFTSYKFADENAAPNGKVVRVPKTLNFKKALSRTVIFTSTVMTDTAKIEKEQLYMPDMGSEDTATWWRLLKSGITAYGLDMPLVIYRRPAESLSSNKKTAVRRIWKLYREVAGLSAPSSAAYFILWSINATFRRIIDDTVRNHIETLKKFVVVQMSLAGILMQTALYALVWFKAYYPEISSVRISQDGYYMGYGVKLFFRGHVLILAIYFLLLLFLSRTNGGMKTGYSRPRQIFGSMVTSLIFTDLISYAQISLMRNWLISIIPMAEMLFAQMITALIWAYMSDYIYRHVFPAWETLVITGNDQHSTDEIVLKFNMRSDRFIIMKTMSAEEGLDRMEAECIKWYDCVVISGIKGKLKEELIQFCYGHYIRVYIVPEVSDLLIQSSEQMDLFNTPILELKEYSIRWEERAIKRLFDIAGSLILLLAGSPVALYRAVSIKLSGKKVITTYSALSMRGKKISCHMFNTEGFGRTLPMLIDVLRGKISLVGPELVPEHIMNQLIASDSRFGYRLRVKPGYIGYIRQYRKSYEQIYSGDKITDSGEAFELLKIDLLYILHYSLLLDFKILLDFGTKK